MEIQEAREKLLVGMQGKKLMGMQGKKIIRGAKRCSSSSNRGRESKRKNLNATK